MLDTVLLSRIQFAFTISFHILFPAFSIGLATFLMIMEGMWLKTKNPLYMSICKFWMKIFALTFGMGIVSGIVMEFQLGTNWSGFTKEVGPVLGALFTYEVLTAFFIEAGFLGVMIFGWKKVGPKLHFLATILVFVGVTLSAFWILSANSWMQTPAGAMLKHAQFVVTSWKQVIFNPSVMPRYFHMMLAAYLATSFIIAGVASYYLLLKRYIPFAKKCLSFSMIGIIVLIPIQIFVGDIVGENVHKYQPIKTAAIEGIWKTQRAAPFLLFAIPEQSQERNILAIKIPYLASLINTHQWDGKLLGLDSVPRKDQPIVPIVFYSFRIMVGIGLLMLLIGAIGLYLRIRKRLYNTPWFYFMCIFAAPLGFVAILTGWFTAECGRQPWVVYGLLKTINAASNIKVSNVIISFVLIILVYGVIFAGFYLRYLYKILDKGPGEEDDHSKQPFGYMQTGGKHDK